MKRLNFIVSVVLIFILSINPIECFAAEAYFTDLVEAELTSQERIDYYNKMLKTERVKAYLDEINSYENVFASLCYDEGNYQYCSLEFYCFNNDYVAFLYAPNGAPAINFISKGNQEVVGKCYQFRASLTDLNLDGSLNAVLQGNPSDFSLGTVMTKNDITYYKRDYWSGVTGYSTSNDGRSGVVRSDVPVFNSETDAILYLEGNDIKPLYACVSEPTDYSAELYFKSFEVIPHATGSIDNYYFDIKYELSDYAKRHINDLNLCLKNMYSFGNRSRGPVLAWLETPYSTLYVPLENKPYGFTLYVKTLGCIKYAKKNWLFSNSEFLNKGVEVDFKNFIVDVVIGSDSTYDVVASEESIIYLTFDLRFYDNGNVVTGKRNDWTYDFLTNESKYYLYTPNTATDIDGNKTLVTDNDGNISYTQEGETRTSNEYYYNEVTQNDNGDTTNKFYYIDNDKNKKEITKDEYDNNAFTVIGGNSSAEGGSASVGDINININNTNNNGSGEYINVNPVDFNQFVKGMEEMLKQFDTKGGLFLLIKDVFSMYPPEITTIAVGAIAAITIVSIICILRR